MRHLANIGLLILLILGLVVAAYNPGMALVLLVILGIFRLARLRKKKRKGGFQDSYDYGQRCHIGTSED